MKTIKTAKYIRISEKWSDSPGEIYIELAPGPEGEVYDITNDKNLSRVISSAIYKILPQGLRTLERTDSNIEMAIDFSSSGYSSPGSMYGPAETSYPPESDEERKVTSVSILLNGKFIGSLPDELNAFVQQEYQKEIDKA